MSTRITKPLFWGATGLVLAVLFGACSTKKNRFTNRQYHRLTTKYNVLFNGKEALQMGETILAETIEDNFFELLEVEPILLKGESEESTTVVPGFDRAEEKAVKAIQKHSMNIKGVQKNDQIDAAYLVLGKARYYDRRFFPALEAFNYLLTNYARPESFVEALIWREKTNIRLYNYQSAVNNLRSLARGLIPQSKHFALANATVAQGFLKLENKDSALFYLQRAAQHAKAPKVKGRYYYITGQLFEALGQKDSAYGAYQHVVDLQKRTPRKFWINAKLNQLLIEAQQQGTDPELEMLDLVDRYDNRQFKHTIYRALGIYQLAQDNDSLAQQYLSLSQKARTLDEPTQKANYRDLADYYFENQQYLLAGAYLDSLLPLLPDASLLQKRTQRERNNLDGVVSYERQRLETDSLLRIMALDTLEQRQFFEAFLANKRAEERAAIAAQKTATGLFRGGAKNTFYFYNPLLVVEGKQYFDATWGNRPNTDNWRWSKALVGAAMATQDSLPKSQEIVLETAQSYLDRLPKTPQQKDSILQRNHNAYLQLGIIYLEKFKNPPLSQQRLDSLLPKNPKAEIQAPALYYLYKISQTSDSLRANALKRKLTILYPDSAYAQLLTNTSDSVIENNQSPKALYSGLLDLFTQDRYDELLQKIATYQVVLAPTDYAPKLALLKANTLGRLQGAEAWQKALQEVIDTYPETPIAQTAQRLQLKTQTLDAPTELKTLVAYKWIFPLQKKDSMAQALTEQLDPILAKQRFWKLTKDPFNETEEFIVVHGITSPDHIAAIKDTLSTNSNLIVDLPNFVILSKAYRQMHIDKSWKKTE